MKVVTGICRLSYPHIWSPKATVEGGKEKYSACLIIPKADTKTVTAIKTAIKAALVEEWPNEKTRPIDKIKNPLKDGDGALNKAGQQRPETVDCYTINPTSVQQPGIIGPDKQDLIDQKKLYAGCYVRAQLAFCAYNLPTSKGIGCYLNNIQLIKDGESLGGRDRAQDVFDEFMPAGDEDDEEDSSTAKRPVAAENDESTSETESKSKNAFPERTGKTGKRNTIPF